MAKKGKRSKDRVAMQKRFEKMEKEREKARKKAEKALKKAEKKADDQGVEMDSLSEEES